MFAQPMVQLLASLPPAGGGSWLHTWLPAGVTIAGAAIVVVVLLASRGGRSAASAAAHAPADEDARTLRELADQMAAELDARAERLDRLIAEADERLAKLEALATEVTAPREEPERPKVAAAEPEPAAEPIDPMHRQIYALADEGLTAAEIARRLNQHIGSVQLVLALRRA